jgi:hypothetical protein
MRERNIIIVVGRGINKCIILLLLRLRGERNKRDESHVVEVDRASTPLTIHNAPEYYCNKAGERKDVK